MRMIGYLLNTLPLQSRTINSFVAMTVVSPIASQTLKLPISEKRKVNIAFTLFQFLSVCTQNPYPCHPLRHAAVPDSNI